MSASRKASKINTPKNIKLITNYFGETSKKIEKEKENTVNFYDKFVKIYAQTCDESKNCHQMKSELQKKLDSSKPKLASIQKARSICQKICEKKDATILAHNGKLEKSQNNQFLLQPEVLVNQEQKDLPQSAIRQKQPQFSGLVGVSQ